ncbi:uncharacterized protein LOC142462869 [Ascaphus truei]|uniref:uncharacterized protein LOC142462869 n=1 Tax=Ascaphus truei TaxID=8439 RepID=UPI003F596D12
MGTGEFELLDLLAPAQLAELTVQSALNDPTRTIQILALVESPYSSIREYFTQFNISARQANLRVLPNASVRDAMLEMFLRRTKPYFLHIAPEMWEEWFQGFLPLLLPGINETQISWLRTNDSCTSYQAILKGFSQVYENLPHSTRINIYNSYIKPFLDNKALISGVACDYIDYMQWASVQLGNFTKQATFKDLLGFNVNFNKVEETGVLTANELADLTLISDNLCNVSFTSFVVGKVSLLQSYEDVNIYLERLREHLRLVPELMSNISSCDEQKPFDQLSIPTQQKLLSSMFIVLNQEWSMRNMSEWLHVFNILLMDFTVAINESHILRLPLNISCGSYQAVIKALNDAYSKLSQMESEFTYSYCNSYLTQQLKSTGSACALDTDGSETWVTKNMGAFSTRASISELTDFYPRLDIGVLFGMLTPNEMAAIITKEDIFSNHTMMTRVLSFINVKNITEYVTAITFQAAEANLSDSQLTTLKETLLDVVLTKLSSDFYLYGTEDWKTLLQKDLALLLPNFNQTLLQLLPTNITCSSYQEIVKGFSITYESLSIQTKDDVYTGYIKKYMSQQSSHTVDVACNSTSVKTWVEVNLGNFIQQSTVQDLTQFNKNFTKVETPALLTSTELADFTFIADVLQNSTLSTILLSQIKELKNYESLLEYLLTIQHSICQNTSSSSCDGHQPLTQLSMHTQQELLTNVFIVLNTEWSLLNMSEWLGVFDILIADFIVALNETHISQLPLNISCGNYQAIIQKLNEVSSKLNDMEMKSGYAYCKSYLTQQQKSSGSACVISTNGTKDWIKQNLGSFSTGATFSELMELYPDLDIGILLEILTPNDAALLLTKSDVLSNNTLLKEILSLIEPWNITEYVIAITSTASKVNLSESQIITVKGTLLSSLLIKLNSNFSFYKTEDWKILFQKYLVLLLPDFNQTLLQLLPTNISCSSYQEIVKGFSISYESLSNKTKDDIYMVYLKRYLNQSQSTDVACDTVNLRTWVEFNLGKFIQQSSAQDLTQFNKNFTKVENPALLTATELADVTFLADTLQNGTLITVLLNQIQEFNNYGNLLEYLLRVQSSLCQSTNSTLNNSSCDGYQALTQLSVQTEQELLSNMFIILNKEWTSQNMPAWLQVFHILLHSFSVGLTESHLPQLPFNVSCGNYQAIIKELSDVYYKLTDLQTESVYTYCKLYLTQQRLSTGSACALDTSDSEEWVRKNIGLFYTSATMSELTDLYPNLDIAVVLEILTTNDVPLLLTKVEFLLNNSLLRKIVSLVEKENITGYVMLITDTALKANLSDSQLTTLKETLLDVVLTKLSSDFYLYDKEDWKTLLQKNLALLLPNFNQTLLQLLPTNITCSSYQEM